MKSFRELYDLDAGVSIGRANPPTSAPSVIVLARSNPLRKPPDAIIGIFTELRISSKLEGEELCVKDVEKIKELLESIKLDVEIDLNYGVYLDEKSRVIIHGKKGFSKDEIEKVMTRLRAHLPDYEIKDHQEKWGSKDILDLSLGTITEELGKFGTDDYFKHFYNFSVNPFNEDIFNKVYELSKEEKSESDGNNFNYTSLYKPKGCFNIPRENYSVFFEKLL